MQELACIVLQYQTVTNHFVFPLISSVTIIIVDLVLSQIKDYLVFIQEISFLRQFDNIDFWFKLFHQ